MSGPDLPSSPPPTKPKLSTVERRARQADRLTTIRLRMAIWRVLDERGVGSPAEIGKAFSNFQQYLYLPLHSGAPHLSTP